MNNSFDGNKAQIVDSDLASVPDPSLLEYELRGGAINIWCNIHDDYNCAIEFAEENRFRNNFATNQGGAISVVAEDFTVLNGATMIFEGNTALLHSNDVSYYATAAAFDKLESAMDI